MLELVVYDLFDYALTKSSGLWKDGEKDEEIIDFFTQNLNNLNSGVDYFELCDLGLYKETFDSRKFEFIKDSLNTKNTLHFIEFEINKLINRIENPLDLNALKAKIVYIRAYEKICEICISIFKERIDFLEGVIKNIPEGYEDKTLFLVPQLSNSQITLLLYELGIIDRLYNRILKKKNVSDLSRFLQPLLPGDRIGTIKPRLNPIVNDGSESKSDIHNEKNRKALETFLSHFDLKIEDLKK